MPHEKAGDLFHWKYKLDELELPGEPLSGKEAAWQKLHERLQQRPRRKRVAAYWAAAACLLLAWGGWLAYKQSGSTLVKEARQMPVHSTTAPIPATGSRDTMDIALRLPAEKKYTLSGKPKNKVYQPTLKNTAVEPSVALQVDSMKTALPDPVLAMQPADTTNAAAIKKKLRVVHINTLGKVEEEVLLAGNAQPPYQQARLINRDDPSNSSTSRYATDNIVRIKLSSSN